MGAGHSALLYSQTTAVASQMQGMARVHPSILIHETAHQLDFFLVPECQVLGVVESVDKWSPNSFYSDFFLFAEKPGRHVQAGGRHARTRSARVRADPAQGIICPLVSYLFLTAVLVS